MLFGLGILLGGAGVYAIKYFEKESALDSFKEGFVRGFETTNGHKPFTEEEVTPQIQETGVLTTEDMINDLYADKPERWD